MGGTALNLPTLKVSPWLGTVVPQYEIGVVVKLSEEQGALKGM